MTLKILCLHGYRQNSDKFRVQTGALRKICKNKANFHFVNAPHIISDSKDENQRAWWFTKDQSFNAKDEVDTCTGFEDSLNSLDSFCNEFGPFDGILGFSQGAAMAALLCSFREEGCFNHSFKFVILISGFVSKSSVHFHCYEQRLNIPSLHVFGKHDDIISENMSMELVNLFNEPKILRHDGGHFVPGTSSLKADYLQFLAQNQPS